MLINAILCVDKEQTEATEQRRSKTTNDKRNRRGLAKGHGQWTGGLRRKDRCPSLRNSAIKGFFLSCT